MADGKTHDLITYVTCLPVAGVAWYFYGLEVSLIILMTYLFAGLMFNGDLDIHSNPYKRWGPIRFIWLPYRGMIKHRSFWSHGILIGTLIRVLWILPFLIPFLWLIEYKPNHYTIIILVGLELGAISHILADKLE